MPPRDRWCHHVPPATAVVACSGEQHRISWRRGKLKIEDHDLSAERTMLAFGGDSPECLQVLTLWRNLHSWAMSAQLLQQMQSRLSPGVLLAPGDLRRVHDLGLLLTWDRAWRRSLHYSEHGRLLGEKLKARATAPLRAHLRHWMPRFGSLRISGLSIEAQRRDQHPTLQGVMDRVAVKATATLGVRWLVEVAARDVDLVDGAFVLEITDETVEGHPGAHRVRAVRWEEQGRGTGVPVVRPALVRRTAEGAWSLEWEDQP